ncbi:hypothetical protein PFISCL1PPCAC_2734 [Pristionchus fissidentatus]|uniref:Myb-like domain-containing protein n=1 Tax=Pristionchus fissidentatus TaxID=1538716 RepID=A0AAV5UVZ2_9BILA|nr:hypothetical protein PFISCL1PPCAC_2733 [Pristionchus fissidentatus]GMT11437.1 hypothetical protein PFISCL1PPCAC_2734 [Pristionchus fissidentatus]
MVQSIPIRSMWRESSALNTATGTGHSCYALWRTHALLIEHSMNDDNDYGDLELDAEQLDYAEDDTDDEEKFQSGTIMETPPPSPVEQSVSEGVRSRFPQFAMASYTKGPDERIYRTPRLNPYHNPSKSFRNKPSLSSLPSLLHMCPFPPPPFPLRPPQFNSNSSSSSSPVTLESPLIRSCNATHSVSQSHLQSTQQLVFPPPPSPTLCVLPPVVHLNELISSPSLHSHRIDNSPSLDPVVSLPSSSSTPNPAHRSTLTSEEQEFRLYLADIATRFPSCSWEEVSSAVTMPLELLRERCKSGASKVGPKKTMLRFVLNKRL